MINEEWKKKPTQNEALLLPLMTCVSIFGLQGFILIPRLNHTGSHRLSDSHSKPYLHWEKNLRFGTRIMNLCNPVKYKESCGSSLILVSSSPATCHRERPRSYFVHEKTQGPHGAVLKRKSFENMRTKYKKSLKAIFCPFPTVFYPIMKT